MRGSTRRILLAAHLYLGLACSGYLVVYGLSALSWHHDWSWLQPTWGERTWTASVPPASGSEAEQAAFWRGALGLYGHMPPGKIRRDGNGALDFHVTRPGRRYDVRVDPDAGSARVEEKRASTWELVRGLHGGTAIEGSLWSRTWSLYTDLSIVTLALAGVTGTALWWTRARRRRGGAIVLAASGAGFLALASWVLLCG